MTSLRHPEREHSMNPLHVFAFHVLTFLWLGIALWNWDVEFLRKNGG